MHLFRFFALASAAAAAACSDPEPTTVDTGPQAYIRFLNAVPDGGPVDFVFVDRVENLPTYYNVGFRGFTGFHTAVNAGDRTVTVFATVPLPGNPGSDQPSEELINTNLVLAEGRYYTIMQVGLASGTGAAGRQLVVLEDQFPAALAEVGVRTVHAAAGVGNVDVYYLNGGTTDLSAPVAAPLTGVAFGTASPWVEIPTKPGNGADTATANFYRFAVTPAGAPDLLVNTTPRVPGTAAVPASDREAVAGVQIKQSLLTAFVLPGAVPGSPAANSSNQTPTVLLVPDRNPPRASP